jgi:2,4-dienoyl-CoA reductase-like NADH-dependent reductase (Old Yellow Enzyme family)
MKLLEPVEIGRTTLRNRAVVTAHTFDFAVYNKGADTSQYVEYLQRRAAGGASLISAQNINAPMVDDKNPFPYDYLSTMFSAIAGAAHNNGSAAVLQIVSVGAALRSGVDPSIPWDGQPLMAFSPVRSVISPEIAHPMREEEIEGIVEGFGRLAELAVASGLDGVELHGGHGYLLHQSLNPWTNMREDRWGEPLAFWTAVLGRVREGLGRDGILGARVPSDDYHPVEQGGLGPDRLRDIICQLVDTGHIDYLNPSEGSNNLHYARTVGTYRRPHGDFLKNTSAIKHAINGAVPVIGVGRITTVEEAEEALERGDCDIVGLTRAHIADPDVIAKTIAGQSKRVRPCVAANVCIDRIMAGTHVRCFHNPDAGREFRTKDLALATTPRKVLVIGGGPAGMKAAELAARRGHRVTLAEKNSRLGGRLGALTGLSPVRELLGALDWLENELVLLDLEIALNTEVDRELLERGAFDSIILATGSVAPPPAFATDGSIPIYSTDEAMSLVDRASGYRVLVHDLLGTEEAAGVTEQLVAAGLAVTATTPLPATGMFMGFTHNADHIQRLLGSGVSVEERAELVQVANGTANLLSHFTGAIRSIEVDGIVLAQLRQPDLALEHVVHEICDDVHHVGDANAPRNAFTAFLEGDMAGRKL